ncbi:MAG TPA: inosine monophosphate cyclohydrolase [Clostridiales bacterium]|nr:inosine monophosphate cyclohydrolase [Clostridiales bacterium]
MKKQKLNDVLSNNTYPGRGICLGVDESGEYAVIVYFIMGRSVNSRNRIFEETDDGIITKAHDESLMTDPHLIIYAPVRALPGGEYTIVTNGDQTDTIYNGVNAGLSFAGSLTSREFEPDKPNFTPRISGMLTFDSGDFKYDMSILKSADPEGNACNRYAFSYSPIAGLGHFIHTYVCDGNPIPTFQGEPERVAIPNDIDEFTDTLWTNLNEDNKISLYVIYTDLETGKEETRLINKNK